MLTGRARVLLVVYEGELELGSWLCGFGFGREGMDRFEGVRRDEVEGWIRGRWEMQIDGGRLWDCCIWFRFLRL